MKYGFGMVFYRLPEFELPLLPGCEPDDCPPDLSELRLLSLPREEEGVYESVRLPGEEDGVVVCLEGGL